MEKYLSRGWVDTEDEAREARVDIFVRGLLIERRNIGGDGTKTKLQCVVNCATGVFAPVGRMMSFTRVPVKPHPDQALLDEVYTLTRSSSESNADLQAQLAALKDQRDAALRDQRATEVAFDARRSADLRVLQQPLDSAQTSLTVAKKTFDVQKSDARVSMPQLIELRKQCNACEENVKTKAHAVQHLAAAHVWVETAHGAMPSFYVDLDLDELIALRGHRNLARKREKCVFYNRTAPQMPTRFAIAAIRQRWLTVSV